ncbi:MAG: winged helix-turn-helix domain-containing protein [Roseateles sp.]|uniref:ATP-binding protein n=1 Tax=Roseateles sp. TaxID=1971397 RepID=UPI0039EC209E
MSATPLQLPAVAALSFGHFEVRPALRQLWVNGTAANVGGRAFDLLMLLLEHRDRVLSKEEILDRVWPGLVVEENNLSVQISTLRRLLGADTIATVTGRGYQFTAAPQAGSPSSPPRPHAGNLPVRLPPLLGRDADLAELLAAYDDAACVTVCGLAGVGKTALADTAALRLAAMGRYAQGAWRIDLTDVRDPALLPQAVCQALGLEPGAGSPSMPACIAALQHRELLLVLDNCEHIIDAAADLVEGLLGKAPQLHVLATSQEPLRVAGERVLRLNPLAVPVSADADGATGYGAVRLLLERVRGAMGGRFEPTAEEFTDLIEICRQLDGIPLALEFAATRVPLLGTTGVRSRLNDRLRLLAGGQRSAPPRHRSLQAALEWSHQLLSPRTREVLHQLAVFPSGFSLAGARLLLGDGTESDLIEHLDILVDRSLVGLQPGRRPRYRMLETTRAFALDCLKQSGADLDAHERLVRAMSCVCLLAAKGRDNDWLRQEMPNARAALAWALPRPTLAEEAVVISTYTSVALGATGAIGEALDNLLRVQGLVTDARPGPLRARYWHWLGRLGVEGRLPGAQCIAALERADALFETSEEPRHRHGCQRHLAEAHLRAGRLEQAERHLQAAREFEAHEQRPADRVRRLRVEVLLADARNEHATALRHAQSALTLAEAHGIDRYRLLLLADMAWTHLQMGHADAAAAAFQDLLAHLGQHLRHGQARARAMSGLTAALVAAGRIDEAMRGAMRTAHALQLENLLRSRCEIFAWLAAAAGAATAAAQLLGASDDFTRRTGIEPDPISQLARAQAGGLIDSTLSEEDRNYWQAQGGSADSTELMHLLERTFAARPTAPTPESDA